jgi:flagellar biogenesis protein FliO
MNLTNLLSHSTKQPKTILRIIISVSVGLLVLWIFLVSKMELPSEQNSVLVTSDSTQSVVELRNSLLGEERASQSDAVEGVAEETPIFQGAFTTFFVMVTVLGGVWLWTTRKKKKVEVGDQDIKEITQHVIGQGVQLKILEINDEIWVLGVTANAINLLHRYPKSEWHPSKLPDPELEEISGSDFNSIFKLLGN